MIDNEGEVNEAQPGAIDEAEAEEVLKRELWEHPEILELVVERKKRKFTRSGLFLTVIGVVLIACGLLLNIGTNSFEGLIVGGGALVGLVGILRILIGLIKPIVPSQL